MLIQEYRYGNPAVPAFKPPKTGPSDNFNRMATPAFNAIGLRNFVTPGILEVKGDGAGTTLVCFWMPTAVAINRIVATAEMVHSGTDLPLIIDIGTANGFLAFLLANTGRVRVVGVEPNKELLQSVPYSHANLELVHGDAEWAAQKYISHAALVLQSWPPLKANLTPAIRRIDAPALVHVFPSTLYRTNLGKRFLSPRGYRQFVGWQGPCVMDMNTLWTSQRPPLMENTFVVLLNSGAKRHLEFPSAHPAEEYPWVTAAKEKFGATFIDGLERAERIKNGAPILL